MLRFLQFLFEYKTTTIQQQDNTNRKKDHHQIFLYHDACIIMKYLIRSGRVSARYHLPSQKQFISKSIFDNRNSSKNIKASLFTLLHSFELSCNNVDDHVTMAASASASASYSSHQFMYDIFTSCSDFTERQMVICLRYLIRSVSSNKNDMEL